MHPGAIRTILTASALGATRVNVTVRDALVHDLVLARAAQLGLVDGEGGVVVRGPEPTAVEPGTTEIVLIDHVDAEALAHCGRRSVGAVVSFQAPPELLDLALRGTGSGLVLDPAIAARLAGRDDRRLTRSSAELLTARQLEIVRGLAAGRSMRQIASALGITVKTVENQATRIYATLTAANRHEAVQRARELGLLEGDG